MISLKQFWTKSIARQLMLGIALVHAVLMTIFVIDLVAREKNFLIDLSEKQAIGLAETLAANGTSWILAQDFIGMEEIINSQSGFPGLKYAMFLDKKGKVLSYTDIKQVGKYIDDEISKSLFKVKPETYSLIDNTRFIDIAAPILANNHHIGWARVGISREGITDNIRHVTQNGLFYTLAAIITGTIFAWFMGRGLTSGLRRLSQATHGIAIGDKTVNCKLERHDELGVLSDDFNKMLTINRELIGEIKEREQNLAITLDSIGDAVIVTDEKGNITRMNPVAEHLTGWMLEEAQGKSVKNIFPIIDATTRDPIENPIEKVITSGEVIHLSNHTTLTSRDGTEYQISDSAAPIRNRDNNIMGMVLVFNDVTERKQAEKKILHQAHFDALTDLPNRFLSLDRLLQLINEARCNNELVTVLYLDLDDFKKINDSLGHDVGDKLLIEAAARLSSGLRCGDTVGRLGGDEFIVLLRGLTDLTDASPVIENLLEKFREAFRIDNRELMLTASIGVAVYPNDGNTPSELLRKADSAMYHSKEEGRNTYSYFTEAMNKDVSRRLALEEQMHGALERGEFRLHYQPKVDITTCNLIGVEALLRWNNPALGEVTPCEFIPIAEQTGLIIPIGQFVLNKALEMTATWQQKYEQPFSIAVNLSPRQFRDPNLVTFIKKAIAQSGVSGKSLELEIIEGVLMSGHAYIDEALEAINSLGISIAMDDFGTGYSSLSYLRRYPFDVLKIDRSFVNDIIEDKADRELVNAAIAMAHSLGLKVVAEGVETEEQRALLAKQGCEIAQGYLFSKPVSAEEITAMLVSANNG